MSVVQKLIDAQDNQDLKAYNEVLSEDYYWLDTQLEKKFLEMN